MIDRTHPFTGALAGPLAPARFQEATVSRFYVTTPIYYVNDIPHVEHVHSLLYHEVFDTYEDDDER